MDFLQRKYTAREEIFNSVSHGAGVLLSIAGCAVLVTFAAIKSDAAAVVSAAIYGASLIILYTMSTLYHALTNSKAKKVFQILDHSTIFLLIAGTYTPFCLSCLKGADGWTLFGVIWGFAVLGIILSSVNLNKFRKISTICYVVMGWAVIFRIVPLSRIIPSISTVFLIVGGVMYSAGVIFYTRKELRYMHSVWHLFVVAGSVFHYFSIFFALTS